MSTHNIKVIRVSKIEKHPNADTLGIIHILGFQIVVRLGEFNENDLAVYIEPDYIVPATEQFAFLGEHRRIKVKKLRGIYSQGLLIKAPEGTKEGDDVMEMLNIIRYEPPEPMSTFGEDASPPKGHYPVYDVEGLRKYPHIIKEGEQVIITEKIHGSSGRFVMLDGVIHLGSRTGWKKIEVPTIWSKALEQNKGIIEWCRKYEKCGLYGEVYGQVQNLKYGAGKNQIFFRVFDVWNKDRWEDRNSEMWNDAEKMVGGVPILYSGPFDAEKAYALAEGKSTIADNFREGCVVRAVPEKWNEEIGRVQLKIVGNDYFEKVK